LLWLDYTTNSQSEIIKEMVIDNSGNIIQLIQTAPWIPTQPWGGGPFKIRKINSSGLQLWTKTLDVQMAVSIDTDSNGNIFILGSSGGTTDLNPDPLVINSYFTSNSGAGLGNNRALFVLKLNSLGIFQNFSTIGAHPNCNGSNGCGIFAYPIQIRVDNSDNILFTFKFNGGGFIDIDPSNSVQNFNTSQGRSFTLIKWSNNLDSLGWINYLYGSQSETNNTSNSIDITPKAMSFDIDSNNNVYLASLNNKDILLSKYSANGTLINNPWQNKITGYGYNNIGDISVLSNNEIILGGNFVNYIDVNPITGNQSQTLTTTYPIDNNLGPTPRYYTDAFLVKYDSSFNVVWKQKISSILLDEIEDIECYSGNIYICGLSEYDDIFSGKNWVEFQSYLKIYNADGSLFKEKKYISPYPEDPITTAGVTSIFGGARKAKGGSGIYAGWVFDWGKRTLAISDSQTFYIGGEYSAYPSTNQGSGWNLYTSSNFSRGFDWDVCSIIPNTHLTGSQTIPLTGFIRPYLAKYNTVECALSNEEIIENKFSVYPNPSSNIIHLNSNLDANYKLISILGKQVANGNISIGDNLIDISIFSSGVYFLKINTLKGTEILKIIKE
jgi:hypothetical protein